ncbi:protein phosphatase 2C domain-containing protein [Trichothermofontia sichuanensis B231]|uniref:protein phosphatase 2C domain-containing protein n=1 Tax=Trichothermofontia sichuanensis TaxID=3045816 RepID=UPI002245CEDC|nr:protein phosphatase 2C domain-containing protein [Trichothermofontia sichuanensis]UZQ55662.1 protein phosphatase 2C domain-containing protein [Trichothermofontia sichuanensis B231]
MNEASLNPPRYLWAVGDLAAQIPVGERVADRYEVVAPRLWQDTQPESLPEIPRDLPDRVRPYLYLYPLRLHLPVAYGFCHWELAADPQASILLLDHVPVKANGQLYPTVTESWPYATALRQVYWFWQILELWTPLSEQGVVSSLLHPDNVRVEGWCIRLLELYPDNPHDPYPPSLATLMDNWAPWLPLAQPAIVPKLQLLAEELRSQTVSLGAVLARLNQLLLQQSAEVPLRLRVAGGTDPGPNQTHNEDSCYPTERELQQKDLPPHNRLIPALSLVCDGIGGHEGGEVASQLAVQTLKLQIQALLTEVASQEQPLAPEVVSEQIVEAIRVVNNVIAAQNDQQQRSSRQRMGTTLVMALQLPQRVNATQTAHELYLAWVGDSRAYWITEDYCQPLTLDDDVATREVRLGRALYQEVLRQPDAGALTQAIGTREASLLYPTVQRLIIDEDGLLLLCSDGLSDHGLVEQCWQTHLLPVLRGEQSVSGAVPALIAWANQHNGHDNTSVVLTYCRVSPEYPVLIHPLTVASDLQPSPAPISTADLTLPTEELTAASKALLYETEPATDPGSPSAQPTPKQRRSPFRAVLSIGGLLVLVLLGGSVGLLAWSQLYPESFQELRLNLPSSVGNGEREGN